MLTLHPAFGRRPSAHARSRRRGERGAAMVEAAFMLPMFVLLWFTSLYAHRMGATQIDLNTEARANAWQYAMANCGTLGTSPSENEPGLSPPAGTTNPGLNGMDDNPGTTTSSGLGSAPNGEAGKISKLASPVTNFIADLMPNPTGSVARIKKTINWREPNLYVAGGGGSAANNETNMQQTVTLVCNQYPQNGNILSAIKGIVCMVSGKLC